MGAKPNPLGDRWPTDVGGQDSFQIKRGRIVPTTRQELREVIEQALSDPAIFFVENEEHASDYWRRQAIRVEAALTTDHIGPSSDTPENTPQGQV